LTHITAIYAEKMLITLFSRKFPIVGGKMVKIAKI
jgi:hypothetical protein